MVFSMLFPFNKFKQDAACGFRVNKGDSGVTMDIIYAAWRFVDQPDSFGLQIRQGLIDIFHPQGYMLDTFAFIFDETGNGSVRGSRFQEFDFRVARGKEESDENLLFRYFSQSSRLQSQGLVEFYGFLQAFNGNANMVYLVYFHAMLLTWK